MADLPSIDVSSIDMSVCAVCGVDIDIFHWDNTAYVLKECCGSFLCEKCHKSGKGIKQTAKQDTVHVVINRDNQIPSLFDQLAASLVHSCAVCGTERPKSEEEQVSRVLRLAEAGHPRAQLSLGSKYKCGISLKKDPILAVKWVKRAAESGDKRAFIALAHIYHYGDDGVDISYEEAKHWCDRAVAGNDANALCLLGDMYLSGNGVQQDRAKALELFHLSAEQGCPLGLKACGRELFEDGAYENALEHFETCARMEKHVAYRPIVALCQLYTAICLVHINNEKAKTGGAYNPAEDLMTLILFWARRAVKNGHEGARPFLLDIESQAHSKCRCCEKPNPQKRCSACRSVSYCDKTCQTKDWRAGHKIACRNLPVLLSPEECAHCGMQNPHYTCQGCGKASYCGESCQEKHWKAGHKDECKFL